MTVEHQMGTIALQFVEIIATPGKATQYRYLNNSRLYTCHSKWKQHLGNFRGRKYGAILSQTVEAESKSGYSYNILGVVAVFDSFDEAQYANQEYWNAIKFVDGPVEKAVRTQQYCAWLAAGLSEVGKSSNFYSGPLVYLDAACVEEQPLPFIV